MRCVATTRCVERYLEWRKEISRRTLTSTDGAGPRKPLKKGDHLSSMNLRRRIPAAWLREESAYRSELKRSCHSPGGERRRHPASPTVATVRLQSLASTQRSSRVTKRENASQMGRGCEWMRGGIPGSSDSFDSRSSAAIRVLGSEERVAERHWETSEVILTDYYGEWGWACVGVETRGGEFARARLLAARVCKRPSQRRARARA